ncbi:MAG: hypothetical protein IK136_00075, partial [Oscillospiraceae bacterium]|nr:hypothetical protein [Oscillospiraceae bacterium]
MKKGTARKLLALLLGLLMLFSLLPAAALAEEGSGSGNGEVTTGGQNPDYDLELPFVGATTTNPDPDSGTQDPNTDGQANNVTSGDEGGDGESSSNGGMSLRGSSNGGSYVDIEASGAYDFYVTPEDSCTLEVSLVDGDESSVTYQWYEEHYESGQGWTGWNEIQGATGSSYTISSVEYQADYFCVATDGEYSDTVYFYVYPDNNLYAYADENGSSSVECYVSKNGTETLRVIVDCVNESRLTYQWYK